MPLLDIFAASWHNTGTCCRDTDKFACRTAGRFSEGFSVLQCSLSAIRAKWFKRGRFFVLLRHPVDKMHCGSYGMLCLFVEVLVVEVGHESSNERGVGI